MYENFKSRQERDFYWSQPELKLCTLVHLALASKNLYYLQ